VTRNRKSFSSSFLFIFSITRTRTSRGQQQGLAELVELVPPRSGKFGNRLSDFGFQHLRSAHLLRFQRSAGAKSI
jgi:hypothetical protein